MKIKEYKNGASVIFEPGNYYTVILRDPRGNVHDKVRCDTRAGANEYYACFCKIAKNL